MSNKCKHFNGIQNDACRAGVNYRSLDTTPGELGLFLRLPCCPDMGDPKLECSEFAEQTNEEIQEAARALEEHTDKLSMVLKAVEPWREKHKGTSHEEIVECPACENKSLMLRISAYNNHVHGDCKTYGCEVRWME